MYVELKIACNENGVQVGTIDDHRIRYEGSLWELLRRQCVGAKYYPV
jgi:hypothetical protein